MVDIILTRGHRLTSGAFSIKYDILTDTYSIQEPIEFAGTFGTLDKENNVFASIGQAFEKFDPIATSLFEFYMPLYNGISANVTSVVHVSYQTLYDEDAVHRAAISSLQNDVSVLQASTSANNANTTSVLATKASVGHNHDDRYYEKAHVDTIASAVDNKVNKEVGKGVVLLSASGITDCPVSAPNDAPTSLNPLTVVLGTLVGEVNDTNTRQNAIANDVRTIGTKVNNILSRLEACGILISA